MPKVLGNSKPFARENKPKGKCRKWQLRVLVEDDFTHEKRYTTKCLSGITYTEAQTALEDWKRELEATDIQNPDITLGEYAAQWLDNREKSPAFAKRTVDNERNKLKNVLLHLSDVKVKDITSHTINELYGRLRSGESVSGRPLAGTTIRNIHKTLTTLMKDAQRDRIASSDVLIGVSVPTNDTKERVPLSNDQAVEIVDKLSSHHPLEMLVQVCVTCGLRRSEALALNWQDIDGEGIHVRKALEEDGTFKATKSERGSRLVPMPEVTRRKLDEWKAFQSGILAGNGIIQDASTPVFTMNGTRYMPHSVSTWWRRHRGGFGLTCTLHDLRHTYATMLARKGVHIRVAQDLVGDESMEVLTQIYMHVASNDKIEAVAKLDELF